MCNHLLNIIHCNWQAGYSLGLESCSWPVVYNLNNTAISISDRNFSAFCVASCKSVSGRVVARITVEL